MISITDHIQYLLLHHDCVIIPGWGALIAAYQSASLGADGSLSAPSRSIGFNPELLHDDGLLASSIVRRDGVSYESARGYIQNEVESMWHRVKMLGVLEISRVGKFELGASGSLEFYPDTTAAGIASVGYMGLPNVSVTEVTDEQEDQYILEIDHRRNPLIKVARVAASVAAMVALATVLTTPIMVPDGVDYFASLNPSANYNVAEPQAAEPVEDASRTMWIAIPDADEATATVDIAEAIEPAGNGYHNDFADDYFLIVGSSKSASAAQSFIAAHPGEGMKVVYADGNYRVAIASAKNYMALSNLRRTDDFKAKYPSAWIYRR